MADINNYAPRSGRIMREDGTIVNEADGIQPDGSRLVKLTGSYAQVIKSFVNETILLTTSSRRYGDNSISALSSVVPLDVSKFKSKSIYIHNKTNMVIRLQEVIVHYALSSGSELYVNIIDSPIAISAGEKLLFVDELMKEPALGLSIQLARTTPPTSGSVDILFLGGVF